MQRAVAQGGGPGARPQDSAGVARPGGGTGGGRRADRARRLDRSAGRPHASADRPSPRARAGGGVGRHAGRARRTWSSRPTAWCARCSASTRERGLAFDVARRRRGTRPRRIARISTRCWATCSTTPASGRRRASASTPLPHRPRVTVLIDDDGPGIAEPLRDAVLQRGVRADEAAPGSGFGLAIVRDLAELYGGGVSLSHSPLGGLRARLDLPRA